MTHDTETDAAFVERLRGVSSSANENGQLRGFIDAISYVLNVEEMPALAQRLKNALIEGLPSLDADPQTLERFRDWNESREAKR